MSLPAGGAHIPPGRKSHRRPGARCPVQRFGSVSKLGVSLPVPCPLGSGPPLVYFLGYVKGVLLAAKNVAILSNFSISCWLVGDLGVRTATG